MDPQLAERLFHEGAFYIILDVPEGTEIGMDYNYWNVGPKFKGIKMIPPGLHFIYYSAVSKDRSQTAPRTGFFHWFEPKEFLVQMWDPSSEEITDKGVDDTKIERLKANILELDQYLGPYPYSSLKKWVSLTNHVTPQIMRKIQPKCGHISAVTRIEMANEREDDTSCMEECMTSNERGLPTATAGDETGVVGLEDDNERGLPTSTAGTGGYFAGVGEFPELKTQSLPSSSSSLVAAADISSLKLPPPHKDFSLRFSNIPQQKYPQGATPIEITQYNMDLSYTLQSIIQSYYSDDPLGILGELQFAFVCFMIGQVYDAFEQWKELVKVLCFSEKAILSRQRLFSELISVMYFQLQEIPHDFLVDIISKSNFLTATLQVFFANIQETKGLNPSLAKKSEQFKKYLTKKFKWDFTSEPEEDAPLIVLENEL